MDPKPVRTLEVVRQELSQHAHQCGILEFQMQREIPTELEKLYNHMQTLNKEAQKIFRDSEEAHAKAKEQMNGKDHLKVVDLPQPTAPEAPQPEMPAAQ